jgi:TolB protein
MPASPRRSPRCQLLVEGSFAALLLAVAACENGTGASPRELAQIQLSDSVVVMNDGATARVNVTLLDQFGAAMEQLPAGTVVRWASVDTFVATVQGGLVKAWGPGQTEVVAQAGTVRASARVRVEAVPPTFTAVAGDGQAAGKGEPLEKRLEVRVLDVHGRPVRDAEVEFAVTAGGGTLVPALPRTDSAGIAGASWTLGAVLGEQKAEARLMGQTVAPLPFAARAMRQIAFVTTRDRNAEIFLMSEDGSHQRNLTNNPESDYAPVWSPDGTKILFVSGLYGINYLYVMDADGSHRTRLTSQRVYGASHAWSPDGTKVVFECLCASIYSDIYLVNADGTGLRNLTNVSRLETDADGSPTWSPDGREVAFVRNGESSLPGDYWRFRLLVIGVDGSGLRTLEEIDRRQTSIGHPQWSPDGTVIAADSQSGITRAGIFTITPDGSGRGSIPTHPAQFEGYARPVWSPDGRMLAYVWYSDWGQEGSYPRIRVANADGSPRTLVMQGPDGYPVDTEEGSPAWSADGKKIAFVRARLRGGEPTSEIYVVAVDGSAGETRLSPHPSSDYSPRWRP